MNKNDNFQSSDLALVALLSHEGAVIEAIEKKADGKVFFSFRRDEWLDEVIQRFWSHECLVDPLTYFQAIKEVKSRIYGGFTD